MQQASLLCGFPQLVKPQINNPWDMILSIIMTLER